MSDLGAARGRILIDTSDVRRAQAEVQSASRSMGASLASIGVSFGAAQFGRFVVESDKLAASYRRQSVAAVTLAGSQGKLNELLSVYDDAMGGAVSKAEAMANVTKLMAVGFADNAAELDKFARAIRGISIAMGMSEDAVTQNLILELFTQRGARLDQLGLQYDKVKARADELRAADQKLTEQQAYQNAVLEQAKQRFGALTDSAAGQKTGIEKLGVAWENFKLQFGSEASGGTNLIFGQWASDIERATNELRQFSDFLVQVERTGRELRANLGFSVGPTSSLTSSEQAFLGSAGTRQAARRNRGQASDAVATPRFTTEQESAITDFYNSVMDAERAAHNDRLRATVEYESQRTQVIRDFGKSMAREEEDFQTQRARSLRDYERSVMSVMRDAQKREADARQALDKTLAESREKSTQRLGEIEKNYNRARERAADAYGKSLRDAAGRLDAKRIAELQDDYRTQEKEREQSYRDQLDQEHANLAERIRQAQEAHQEQLNNAREADAERLADMRANRELQLADEDADRAKRKQRAFEDHNDQLAEMDRQHGLRMAQIDSQLFKERERLKEGLDDFLGLTRDATQAAIAYYDALNQSLLRLQQGPAPQNPYITPGEFPRLNPVMPQANTGAATGTGGRVGGRVGQVSINIYPTGTQSPYDVAAEVRTQLMILLQDLSQ